MQWEPALVLLERPGRDADAQRFPAATAGVRHPVLRPVAPISGVMEGSAPSAYVPTMPWWLHDRLIPSG
jgi:hypothetical protein